MSIKTIIKDDKLRFLASGVGPKVIQPEIDAANDDIVAEAKRLVPVDTGRLRESIHRDGGSVVAGDASAPYGIFIEFGTRHQHPQPFLRPAFASVMKNLPKRIADALGKAMR